MSMGRYYPKLHGTLPKKAKWTRSRPVVVHFVNLRYYANLAHAADYIAAQLNAVRRIMKQPNLRKEFSSQVPLRDADFEWVNVFSDRQWGDMCNKTYPNFYREFLPAVTPRCRSVARASDSYKKLPESERSSNMRCFAEAIVGQELFLIDKSPQDFDGFQQKIRAAARCTAEELAPRVVVIYRKHEYRTVTNVDVMTRAMLSSIPALQGHNITVSTVDFAKLSSREQSCVSQSAVVMVSVFGAALTWTFNQPRGALLIQLCPYDHKCPWYVNIAHSVGVQTINYHFSDGEFVSKKFVTLKVNPSRFSQFVVRESAAWKLP
eukprot:PhM_4_TR4436/c0_g1_i1/m.441